MDDLSPKDYTLVYAANGKLYAVAKNDGKPIEEDPVRFTPELVAQLKGKIDTHEMEMEQLLHGPLGSGVRVRVPKILD